MRVACFCGVVFDSEHDADACPNCREIVVTPVGRTLEDELDALVAASEDRS